MMSGLIESSGVVDKAILVSVDFVREGMLTEVWWQQCSGDECSVTEARLKKRECPAHRAPRQFRFKKSDDGRACLH